MVPVIASSPEDLLSEHVEQLNACIRTGVYLPWADRFADDGELKLVGGDLNSPNVHRGHEAIATAWERVWGARDDGVRIVTVIAASPESATVDYAWRSAPKSVAGQMIVKWDHGRIARMTVTL